MGCVRNTLKHFYLKRWIDDRCIVCLFILLFTFGMSSRLNNELYKLSEITLLVTVIRIYLALRQEVKCHLSIFGLYIGRCAASINIDMSIDKRVVWFFFLPVVLRETRFCLICLRAILCVLLKKQLCVAVFSPWPVRMVTFKSYLYLTPFQVKILLCQS